MIQVIILFKLLVNGVEKQFAVCSYSPFVVLAGQRCVHHLGDARRVIDVIDYNNQWQLPSIVLVYVISYIGQIQLQLL